VSWGEERPACKGVDEPCRAQNRRDEFIVVSGL
jgi:outer membrane protein OmpA-like peptidoglycan-associated protein